MSYRSRLGKLKVSGTVRGVMGAGSKILGTVFMALLCPGAFRGPRRDRLVIFTRQPEPGQAKTRLIPRLGAAGAADLQRHMTSHTLAQARALRRHRLTEIEIRFAGGDEDRMRAWLGADLRYRPQGEGDLGQRMERAFEDGFREGVEAAIIVGCDCPDLTSGIMHAAFNALLLRDLVLGPATDGGYYLVGLRRPAPPLFEGIAWGTGEVLYSTLQKAANADVSVALLPPLADVDRTEDLAVWERAVATSPVRYDEARITVVVPALDEAGSIGGALASVRDGSNVEIIVVDGSSHDMTAAVAHAAGARVLTCAASRARQMNAGAAAATGEILLFLHADTRLPPSYDVQVRRLLARPGLVAGAFRFRLDWRHPVLQLIERLTDLRSQRLRLPYGDQGLFLTAAAFEAVGGFPDLPIMDDYVFVRRLQRLGDIGVVPAAAVTSGRRWRRRGVLRTTLVNQLILAGYHVGISCERLARWYRGGE